MQQASTPCRSTVTGCQVLLLSELGPHPHLAGGLPRRPAPLLQTAIGHWSEMLFPLFSILRQERKFARPPTQFLQLHLKRAHMMEWVRPGAAAPRRRRPLAPMPAIALRRALLLQPAGWLQAQWPAAGCWAHESWAVACIPKFTMASCAPLPQVRANLATALGVGPNRDLPPIMWQEEVDQIVKQMGEPGGGGASRAPTGMGGRGAARTQEWGDGWARHTGSVVLEGCRPAPHGLHVQASPSVLPVPVGCMHARA